MKEVSVEKYKEIIGEAIVSMINLANANMMLLDSRLLSMIGIGLTAGDGDVLSKELHDIMEPVIAQWLEERGITQEVAQEWANANVPTTGSC